MNLLLSIVLTLSIIIIYIIMIQVFTVLFRITGLTKEKARFQVISLLTNSGYTTSESEIITNNRRRRNIATSCMITGTIFNVIIVSLIINIFFNIKPIDEKASYLYLAIAFGVFISLLLIIKIPFVQRAMERFIEWIAKRIDKRKGRENVITVLDVYGKNAIVEVHINKLPEFMVDHNLMQCDLKGKYGLNVLLIKRNSRVIDVRGDTIIEVNDSVIIFGAIQNIKDIFAFEVRAVEDVIDERKSNIVNLIDNYGEVGMTTVTINIVPKCLEGKALFESPLKDQYDLNVLMLKRNNEAILVNRDTVIEKGDEAIIFGPYINIKKLFLEV